jgi:hypothetical protein
MHLDSYLTGSYSIMLVDVMRLRAWFERIDVAATVTAIDLTREEEFRVFRIGCDRDGSGEIIARGDGLVEVFSPREVKVWIVDSGVHVKVAEE